MARIRSIKPEFFLHDGIAELDPLCRLLFIGLWTQADRAGRLVDRPKRLKAALLPYDDCDINGMLNTLSSGGYIVRYSVGSETYIQVIGFLKHQQPNTKESDSQIPPHDTSTEQAPCEHGASITGREGKGKEGKGMVVVRAERTPAAKPSRRKPPDFTLTDDLRAYATGVGLEAAAVDGEWEKFADHEFRDPKRDWSAAWRRWARQAAEWRQQRAVAPPGSPRVAEPKHAENYLRARGLLTHDT